MITLEELQTKLEETRAEIEKIKADFLTRLEEVEVRIKDLFGIDLTQAQKTDLTDGGDSNLHYHSSDRDWEKLGETILTAPGHPLTVSGMETKKHLMIKVHLIGVAGAVNIEMRFNNDSGANYNWRTFSGIGEQNYSAGAAQINIFTYDETQAKYGVFDIINVINQQKRLIGHFASYNKRYSSFGEWTNTAVQINRIDVRNGSAANFSAGSSLTVFGKD